MILLLDALSLLFRAYHALPPLTTTKGEPTGALYGVAVLLVKLIRERHPVGVAFAGDAGKTFRHRAFPAYKAHRTAPPDDLLRQVGRLRTLIAALGVPAHTVADHEADDVLATLARRLDDRDVLIVTGDTDLLQCAKGNVRVLFVGRRGGDPVLYDEAAARARYGIEPEQIPMWKALFGDPSDGLPGVPGVGKQTATKLTATYGSATNLVAHLDDLPPKARDALAERRADLPLWQDLATLRADLPLEDPLFAPVDDTLIARLTAELEALEFKSLVKRLTPPGPAAPPGT